MVCSKNIGVPSISPLPFSSWMLVRFVCCFVLPVEPSPLFPHFPFLSSSQDAASFMEVIGAIGKYKACPIRSCGIT